jgi:tRNA pseudouridine38-40 synthase
VARIRLTIAYDGTRFSGWQSQPDRNAVQDHLEAAVSAVTGGDRLPVHGSGRTDAGVHALAQVAHFDAPAGSSMAPDDWLRALNSHLPPRLRVMGAEAVSDSFHARFSAEAKTYRYRIYHGEVLPPHEFGRAWHLRGTLDATLLAGAVALLRGRHDFRAFAANRKDASDQADATRTLSDVTVVTDGPVVSLVFRGDGFLYKMVRMLTGGAVRVAQGREPPGWLRGFLENPRGPKCPYCAPADGLYLVSVEYGSGPGPGEPASQP